MAEPKPSFVVPDHDAEPEAEPETPEAPRRQSSTRVFIEWAIVVVGAVAVALIIKTFLLQAFYIPSPSMEPTLKVGDRVLVNKLSYKVHDIHRGDIVVFKRPPNAPSGDINDLIKRVVALPGETVEAHDGKVFVDGKQLDEPYLPEGTLTPNFAPKEVPPKQVFVLGDNRQNSEASNIFGPIDESLIVGRAFVRVWPISHIGGI
jgi:signal peptidase I